MTQFNTIDEAILAIAKEYGFDVFGDTSRFIAILSDYAPNHTTEQVFVRTFARADGMIQIVTCIEKKDTYSKLLAKICEIAISATSDFDQRIAIVDKAKAIAAVLDSKYEKCDDPSTVYAEGMNYFRRFPKEDNIPIAMLLFEESLKLGCKDSLQYLSSTYLKGRGIPKNVEKGMHYLKLATEAGNIKASIDYAEHLWKGTDIDKNIFRAVEILKGLDDCNAFFMLAEIFRENAEYEKAFRYYLKGAESNHVYSQYSVALSFATGQGVKRDMKEAIKWLKSAAALGYGEARRKLEELGEKWD